MTTPRTVRLTAPGGTVGVWLHSIGGYSDLTTSHIYPRGDEEASWTMDFHSYHPLLAKGGARVEVFTGGIRTWRGRLAEPAADGQYVANGTWSEASGVYALDGSGNASNTPDTAIDAAIARGAVSWTRPASLSSSVWGATVTTATEPMLLLDLLDQAMTGLGKRWWVDSNGVVQAGTDPTTPSFVVPQVFAGTGLTLAEDDYYSHLIGKYLATGPVFATVTVGDSAAATQFGYREKKVDLKQMGVISSGTATTQLTNRLALTGARLGFAENLNLGLGQATTQGGQPIELCDLRAGTLGRLMGVQDRTRVGGSLAWTDIVIARDEYTDGASTVQLRPIQKAARNLDEILLKGAA